MQQKQCTEKCQTKMKRAKYLSLANTSECTDCRNFGFYWNELQLEEIEKCRRCNTHTRTRSQSLFLACTLLNESTERDCGKVNNLYIVHPHAYTSTYLQASTNTHTHTHKQVHSIRLWQPIERLVHFQKTIKLKKNTLKYLQTLVHSIDFNETTITSHLI